MKYEVAAIAGAALVCLFVLKFTKDFGQSVKFKDPASFGQGKCSHDDNYREADTYQILQQRNKLSRMLNLKQQKIGQMECEVGNN